MSAAVSPPVCLGLDATGPGQVHDRICEGFPFATLEHFEKYSHLSGPTITKLVGIPARTLARRKSADRLKPDESDRLYRLAEVFARATDLFAGDTAAAGRWMKTPRPALGGATPLELATTGVGARQVEALIHKLENGVFV